MERCRGGTRRGLKFPLSPINRPNVSKVLRDHCPAPSALVVNNSQHPCHVRPTSCRAQVLGVKSGERERVNARFLTIPSNLFPSNWKKKKIISIPFFECKIAKFENFVPPSFAQEQNGLNCNSSFKIVYIVNGQANLFRRTLNLL